MITEVPCVAQVLAAGVMVCVGNFNSTEISVDGSGSRPHDICSCHLWIALCCVGSPSSTIILGFSP